MKLNLGILIILFFLAVASRFIHFGDWVVPVMPSKALGGIVPHHLYVRDIVSNFFRELKTDNIDNVIVLGPNHAELGEHNIIFDPPFNDQSITTLAPYIRNTFPRSKLIPVVIKRNISLEECQQLAIKIKDIPGNNLVIASIDFSHYLPSDKAEANDKRVLELIQNNDSQAILKLNSDYLDSPGSLVTTLIYFEQKGISGFDILDNTNSGRRGNPYGPTTSYFSMIFYGQN